MFRMGGVKILKYESRRKNVQAATVSIHISIGYIIHRVKYRLGVLQYYRSELAFQSLLLYTVFFLHYYITACL